MKKLLMIPIILLFACAVPIMPTVNVSDELKQIVYSDKASEKKDGKWTLVLREEAQEGVYVSIITVEGKSVRVDYVLILSNVNMVGFFADNNGDGKIDNHNEIINGIPVINQHESVQKCYENYLIFARDISKNRIADYKSMRL